MKKMFSLILAVILIFVFGTSNVSAYETHETAVCNIKVIDNMSRKETNIVITNENIESISYMRMINSGEMEVAYDVEFDLPISNEDKNPLTRDSVAAEQEEASVRAILKLRYSLANGGEEIKVTNVNGSWACTSSSYSMSFSNRVVSVNDGQSAWGNVLTQYPTSNSFSYDTGWGYVLKYPSSADGMSGARANSEAVATIDGMGGSYTIFVFVCVP